MQNEFFDSRSGRNGEFYLLLNDESHIETAVDKPIISKRLEITNWSEDWASEFFDLAQDDVFNAYPITIYRQESRESALQWIREMIELHHQTGIGKWAIRRRVDGVLLGMGGLTPWVFDGEKLVDLTYRLRQSACGQGYGSESALALIKHGFNVVGLKEITATITPDNTPSIKIATRLGMKFDKKITLKGVETHLFRLVPSDVPDLSLQFSAF